MDEAIYEFKTTNVHYLHKVLLSTFYHFFCSLALGDDIKTYIMLAISFFFKSNLKFENGFESGYEKCKHFTIY